ncbi:hypothetical protein [Agromyces sp. H66]|uniref:hypothetical protein n=1 Tax=Agromyces sp. H66 TaxID=2529859 RepID=UPI0010AA0CD9|nr:hypothetical protein [Agromyces sp. H66]
MTTIDVRTPVLVGRTRDEIAQRLAADLVDGYTVNLGVGIPLAVPRFIPDGIADGRLRLTECAPGITPEQVRQRTAAAYTEELDS